MGLTGASVGRRAVATADFSFASSGVIALAGNPNVGKSTVFNCLTGLNQHTGNWPGKTVELAVGTFSCGEKGYTLVDLPGTYSLLSCSPEEEVTAEFLRSGRADGVVVVCDATCLERNLSLVLQIGQLTDKIAVCLNLMDEAEQAKIQPDVKRLEQELGVPVIPTAAGCGRGMDRLKECLRDLAEGKLSPRPAFRLRESAVFSGSDEERTDFFTALYVKESERIAASCSAGEKIQRQRRLDRFLTGRFTGTMVMLFMLMGVFWLTIQGANYPSALLQNLFAWFKSLLWQGAKTVRLPWHLAAPLIDGVYDTTAKIVSVMLPPMAIFFPLFTLLEDFGYLPRVAFMLDHRFQKCGSCGKQALTMCMGFGCNAAGVVGCRIIDSPRERKIAVLTNALVPCNGRFPMLIALIFSFFSVGGFWGAVTSAGMLTGLILLCVLVTFFVSWVLDWTVLRGTPSSFAMEMPPFRKPRILQVLYRSLLDRTVYVLLRAVAVAAPAGLILWCVANIQIGGSSVLLHLSRIMEPAGSLLGIGGAALTAFLLGTPANELVLPIILMILGAGGEGELVSLGWTGQTAFCVMLFCLFHWPCSTTIITIWKETKSLWLTLAAVLIPTAVGAVLCMGCHGLLRIFG